MAINPERPARRKWNFTTQEREWLDGLLEKIATGDEKALRRFSIAIMPWVEATSAHLTQKVFSDAYVDPDSIHDIAATTFLYEIKSVKSPKLNIPIDLNRFIQAFHSHLNQRLKQFLQDALNPPDDSEILRSRRGIEKAQAADERPQEEAIARAKFREQYERLLGRLDKREYDVYQGWEFNDPMHETATKYNVSKQRIEQIKNRALKKMTRPIINAEVEERENFSAIIEEAKNLPTMKKLKDVRETLDRPIIEANRKKALIKRSDTIRKELAEKLPQSAPGHYLSPLHDLRQWLRAEGEAALYKNDFSLLSEISDKTFLAILDTSTISESAKGKCIALMGELRSIAGQMERLSQNSPSR